jgi:hypothetical protein
VKGAESKRNGRCEAFVTCVISDGYFGPTRLDGVVFSRIDWWTARYMRATAYGA